LEVEAVVGAADIQIEDWELFLQVFFFGVTILLRE